MELLDYLKIINRRKWVVIMTTLVTVVIVGLGTFLMTPIYSTSALVRIAQIQDSNIGYYDLSYSQRLMNTYALLLSSGPFLDEVIQTLDLKMSLTDLEGLITIEVVPDTELISITAEHSDPILAMQIATTIGELLVEQREDLYTGQGRSSRELLEDQLTVVQGNLANDREQLQKFTLEGVTLDQEGEFQELIIRIRVQEQTYAMLLEEYDNAVITEAAFANSISLVKPATVPDSPSKPNRFLNVSLGILIGLAGGLGLAFIFENIDTTIHTADELEQAITLPILGSVPRFSHTGKFDHRAILVVSQKHASEREAFRILRTNIQSLISTNGAQKILITSAETGAGKSTILVNLAVAMAQTGLKIVVVDTNLRAPCLHETFGLPNDLGLSTIVTDPDQLDPDTWLEKTKIPRISLLSSGPLPSNPTERLGSHEMEKILSELLKMADLALLDSPATLRYADAATIAPKVDGVVIVAAQGSTKDGDIQKTIQQIENVRARTLGVVLNKATM